MTTNPESINIKEDPSLSRRRVLELGAAVAAGLVLPKAVETARGAVEVPSFPESEAELVKRFERYGLEEFVPFYNSVAALRETYGVEPKISCRGEDILTLFDRVAQGIQPGYHDVSKRIIEELQQPWGEEKDRAVEVAHEKMTALDIQFAEGVDEHRREMTYQVCADIANTFPLLAIAAPSTLEVNSDPWGGGFIGRDYDGEGNPTGDGAIIISAGSSVSIDDMRVVRYHEGMHSFDYRWVEEARPYISKESFVHFLATETGVVRRTLDAYFSLPWEKARSFKYGDSLMPFALLPHSSIIDGLEERFMTFADNEEQVAFTADSEDQERYNQLLHAIGRKLVTVRAKAFDELSDQEKEFIKEYDKPLHWENSSGFKTHMSRIVEELRHFYVGPVQKAGGGFPDYVTPPDHSESLMTRLNIEVQSARLGVVSSLSSEDYINNPLGAVRDALVPYASYEIQEMPAIEAIPYSPLERIPSELVEPHEAPPEFEEPPIIDPRGA